MSISSLSPADLNPAAPQRKNYLETAISERGNPFRGFDWGDHLISIPQPPAKASPGLIAPSKPYWSSLPFKAHVFDSISPSAVYAWNHTIVSEVVKLADDSHLPLKTIDQFRMTREEDDAVLDVISVGIDVCRQVDKADAETFVMRCSGMLASHQIETAVVEVNYRTYWGGLAER